MTHSVLPPDTTPLAIPSRGRTRISLILTFLGLVIFLLGAKPALFGLDRSPVVGFVQVSVFTVGLGVMCLGGYIGLTGFWKSTSRTIAADIGSRLVATGYVIAVFAVMADVFGMGTQTFPRVPLYYLLWEGDEEFPARMSVLFERSIEESLAADAIWALVTRVSSSLLA
jgi:hypothetical protein